MMFLECTFTPLESAVDSVNAGTDFLAGLA